MPSLNPSSQAVLNGASRQAIVNILSTFPRYFSGQAWLDTNNRYKLNCAGRLSNDAQIGGVISDSDLAEYIAASAPLHCMDGWSLIGRAISSHARGDADASRHFAYYAELRAAMSILASEGIGIFDDRHYVVDAFGTCTPLSNPRRTGGPRTHRIAWMALEYWATQMPSSAVLFGNAIRPDGRPLQAWLNAFNLASTGQPFSSSLFQSWGLDLSRYADDRDARNIASYQPTALIHLPAVDATIASDFMCSLWELTREPSAPSPFGPLDSHLLRLALEKDYAGTSTSSSPTFASRISKIWSVLPVADTDSWTAFFERQRDKDDLEIIRLARQISSITDSSHHMEVISRASLLLRVASGACSMLLQDSGLSANDLEFWWGPLGEERGIWESATRPQDTEELADLWSDCQKAIDDLVEWKSINPVSSLSYYRFHKDKGLSVDALTSCELMALWGLLV